LTGEPDEDGEEGHEGQAGEQDGDLLAEDGDVEDCGYGGPYRE
jgi:hypothetical protein